MGCRAGASGVWAFTVRGEPTESKMATALAIRRVVIGEVTVLLRCRPAREYHERLTSPPFAPAWTRWATCGFTVDDQWAPFYCSGHLFTGNYPDDKPIPPAVVASWLRA